MEYSQKYIVFANLVLFWKYIYYIEIKRIIQNTPSFGSETSLKKYITYIFEILKILEL